MPAKLTTAAQVNGYRFIVRRLEHALVRWDPRMLHDPMRAQGRAFAVGLVLAILALAGCAVYGLIRPQGTVGDAHIVAARGSGALYVVVDGTLHPALNLASARLVTNSAESPKLVGDKKLRSYPRGPLLGIPGAPAALPGPTGGDRSSWAVCDTLSGSAASGTVNLAVLGTRPRLNERVRPAGANEAVLVRISGADVAPDADGGERTYLLFGDRRARVDLADPAVRKILRLEGVLPRPVSAGLLNAFREVPPIVVPGIVGRGAPAALRHPGVGVGSVVRVSGVGGDSDFYVAFADGVQRVGRLAAELVRSADSAGASEVPSIAPAAVAGLPIVNHLAVQDFPSTAPKVAPLDEVVTCLGWERGDDRPGVGTLLLGRGLPLPAGSTAVRPSSADGPGPGVDQVYVPPGTGRYVQVTGSVPDSPRAESLFYVTDSGVRHGVSDPHAGAILGLGERPAPVPWAVVSLLPAGPILSRAAALVSHDGIEPDAAGAVFELPRQRN
ncbi:type VII secretion protein EccB [Jongsikchunia kroppenstedtii]|uniref:type VII secretion protein EccB n=1 Tax=Jongsikchunia kroppenstedtii TaxID=1121721 RepID=UPI00036DE66A|nr:type VII secretion protein EccB [Jongsikchunia kroppenstedtii]